MMDYNNVTLVGRLGKDPVLFSTKNGKPVARFSVATARRTKVVNESGETYGKETLWHDIVVWGSLAENCNKYLKKGSSVFVNGELRPRSYEKDGQKHYRTEVSAEQVLFLSGGKRAAEAVPAEVAESA